MVSIAGDEVALGIRQVEVRRGGEPEVDQVEPVGVDPDVAEVAADLVTAAPRTITLTDAAALPLTGLAARQAAVELAGVRAGQTVLVNGAGGAVGSMVVQLAADAGARVTAVDTPQHAYRLSGYDAEKVVGPLDLDAGSAAVGGPFDVVVNHVRLAPEDLAKLTPYAADGGIVVSSAGLVPADEARAVRTAGVWVRPDASHLADLVSRVDNGVLKLHVADRRPPTADRRPPTAGGAAERPPGREHRQAAPQNGHHRDLRPRRRPPSKPLLVGGRRTRGATK